MANHTYLTLLQAKSIGLGFGLTVNQIKTLGDWSSNSNYLLDCDEGKFILSIIEDQSLEETIQMAKVFSWLENQGYFTNRIQKDKTGKEAIAFRGKGLMIKSYIPGKVHQDLTAEMLIQVGHSMALLHELPVPEFLPEQLYYEHPEFDEVVGLGIDDEYEKWLKSRVDTLTKNFPDQLPKGLIHGDTFWDNVIFENKQFRAIIDFELACHHYKLLDIGMALVGLCAKQNQFNIQKARSFVEGYQQVRSLTQEEKLFLQSFTEYAAVKTSNWRFRRFWVLKPEPENQQRHRDMMRLAKNIEQIPKQEFQSVIFDHQSDSNQLSEGLPLQQFSTSQRKLD